MSKIIPLNKSKFTIVDDDDYEMLISYCYGWYCSENGYAVTARGKYMHRLIMGNPSEGEVDHIDGDKLNNQRSNLRIVNRSQNNFNQKPRVNTTSKFKGVCWSKATKKWMAYIQQNRKTIYLGLFTNEIDAAKTYNEAALKYHNDHARLNKIEVIKNQGDKGG